MPWTIPPDSRAAIDRSPPAAVASPTPGASSRPLDELALIESIQRHLAAPSAGLGMEPSLDRCWEEFCRAFGPDVTRVVTRGRLPQAADELQEAWLAIIERLGSFRPDAALGPFRGWLAVVVRRRLVDRRRAEARRSLPIAEGADWTAIAGGEGDPADSCERAEERTLVSALLEALRAEVSPLNFRVLFLRSIEEVPVAEVALQLGLTPGDVRVRHHRMLGRLRHLADPEGEASRRGSAKFSGSSETPVLHPTC